MGLAVAWYVYGFIIIRQYSFMSLRALLDLKSAARTEGNVVDS